MIPKCESLKSLQSILWDMILKEDSFFGTTAYEGLWTNPLYRALNISKI